MTDLARLSRRIALLAALAAVTALPVSAQGPRTPDATIRLEGGAVALGVGYSWGKGNLRYQGTTYPFRIRGLSVVDIGASKYTATGRVYNLKRWQDLAGTYAAAEAGAVVGGGGAVTSMKNDRGVVIEMDTTQAGARFTLAPKGMTIKWK